MSMSASLLKRSILPRRSSLTRGCVTPRIFAASFCLNRRDVMTFWRRIMRSARTRRCSASSARNPTSRNTLPLDRVTFSTLRDLPFRDIRIPPRLNQDSEPLASQRHVLLRRPPGSLLERVENVHAFRKIWRCRAPDAPAPYEYESRVRRRQRWSSVSSRSAGVLAGPAAAGSRQRAGHRLGWPSRHRAKTRARAAACPTHRSMQVSEYLRQADDLTAGG